MNRCCYLEIGPIKIEQIDILIHPNHSQTYGIDAMCVSVIWESVLTITNTQQLANISNEISKNYKFKQTYSYG